ncbi:hypothetical protein [Elongatibacter sediminis]|uniref:Terminase large subunit gp17-like C-terminal domain-containing protein n=1 Tax=Elongatibacter sediminis TaxID=3119006 RepID=A0AAW9RL59_9GAMM
MVTPETLETPKPSELQDGLWIRSRWYVGVDLGQAHDPTAVCVLEEKYAEVPPNAWGHNVRPLEYRARQYESPLLVRHLERLPLEMTYPAQVEHVRALLARPPLREPLTLIDYTGVGRPVFDLFKKARVPRLKGVAITAGNQVHKQRHGWSVPKQILMSKLQALLHSEKLRIAAGIKDAPVLLREMKDFRVNFTSAGNAIFNAREGAHDDLVLAVALAVFGATQPRPASWEDIAENPVIQRIQYRL